jgi:actin-related protein
MTTTSSYFDRKAATSIRPGLSHLQPNPPSPQTPQRVISSAFSSPSLSYRVEEESLIFEFGARHFSAGFAGETSPRCRFTFGPEDSRRVGDYRRWLPGFEERKTRKRRDYDWGEDHELWQLDMREADLGLVEDKIERAVREAYTKCLLLDSKSRRVVLLSPSLMPHPLLSCILNTLFLNFNNPTITLMPVPLVCMAAAGCRSGLVVDIGWGEAVVTGLYEYCEIYQSRTTRAMKAVTRDMARLLHLYSQRSDPDISLITPEDAFDASIDDLFEHAEEVTTRMAWCKSHEVSSSNPMTSLQQEGNRAKNENEPNGLSTEDLTEKDPLIYIPRVAPSHPDLQIRFSHLALPVETALFAHSKTKYDIDDNDQPLHILIYKTLSRLSPDVRSLCMSRIIITGGGSHIPGLKSRLLAEVSAMIKTQNWDPMHGKATDGYGQRLTETRHKKHTTSQFPPTAAQNQASSAPHPIDPIAEKLRLDQEAEVAHAAISGVVRGVETLGAWAGGSLLASLKIKSVVEIDRDTFLQHGIAGARRDGEPSVVALQRQGAGPGIARPGGDKTAWTLGTWA